MKKIWLVILSLWALSLSACGIKNVTNIVKKETPQEVIKQWQTNLVDAFKNTALSQQNLEWNTKINANVVTPLGKADLTLDMNTKSVWYTWEANIKFATNFDVNMWQAMNWNITWELSLITTFDNLYLNLKDINLKSSNPQLMVYNKFAWMMKNKWFSIPKQEGNKQLEKVLSNLNLKDEVNKLCFFKVNKELWEYKYNVSLDKKNIAQFIYNVSKKIDKNYSGSINQIEQTLGSWDVNGVLNIESNKKYFTFSWDFVREDGVKIPLEIKYTEKKLLFKVMKDKFILDLNKEWDNFDGFASFSDNQKNEFKLKLSWTLSKNKIIFNVLFDQNNVKVDLKINWNYTSIDKLDVKIPEDAVPLSELQSALWGWISTQWWGNVPQQNIPQTPWK